MSVELLFERPPEPQTAGGPVVEVVLFKLIEQTAGCFEAVLAEAVKWLASASGYLGYRGGRCVEEPYEYLLMIWWSSLEDHTVGFRRTAAHTQWRTLLAPYIQPDPRVRHYLDDGRGSATDGFHMNISNS